MSRIVGGGYYGMKNFGDDLFGVVSAQAAREFWADDTFRLMCPRVKGIEADFAVPRWFPADVYASFNTLGKASRLAFLLKNVNQADRYVFCGGSVFSSSASGARNVVTYFNHRGLALSAIGVSIGPFSDAASERHIKALLQRFEYISLRDRNSYDIAQSFGLECPVVMAGDLAGLMSRYNPTPEGRKQAKLGATRKVAFSPCNFPESPTKARDYCNEFVNAITSLQVNVPLEVVLLNLNGHTVQGDRSLCEYVRDRLQTESGLSAQIVNYSDVGVFGIWRTIAELDSYISVRLHGAISAFLLNVPFSLFEYHPKCSDFLADINKEPALRLGDGERELKNLILEHFAHSEDLSAKANQFSQAAILNFTSAPWASNITNNQAPPTPLSFHIL